MSNRELSDELMQRIAARALVLDNGLLIFDRGELAAAIRKAVDEVLPE